MSDVRFRSKLTTAHRIEGKAMEIRSEQPEDIAIIRQITKVAFAPEQYGSRTEAAIVDALRGAGALTVSLVAVIGGEVVGHVAFSPVTVDGEHRRWYGLGPVSVRPNRQKEGIGGKLIREGLARLAKANAKGCVVLGDPVYYKRFGFENDAALRFEQAPAEYFMRLAFDGSAPSGRVAYHDGFNAVPGRFELRPATGDDFQFCWLLYRDLMKPLTMELLDWNELGQRSVIEQAMTDSGASIIVVGGSDVGWLQVKETCDELYLGQLYVKSSMQNCGIGTAVVRQLCDRALREGRPLALNVMKNNRARVFYERLGFETIGSSEYKLNMRWRKGSQTIGG